MQEPRLHLFPFSLPDELHASQFGRLHRDSGNARSSHTYSEVYGAAPFRLTQWIPTHIEKFAAKFDGPFDRNLQKLLRENTLFPLMETFCGVQMPDGRDVADVKAQISALPKRLVGSSRKTNLCIDCLICDRESHGTPYIHRAHQAPGTYVCWKHRTRLVDACPQCHFPFEPPKDLILAPWEPCPVCKKFLLDLTHHRQVTEVSEREVELATLSYKLLQSQTFRLSGKVLAGVYMNRIREFGFMRGSTINRIAIVNALENYYGKELLSRIDIAYRKGGSPHWFVMCNSYAIFEAPLSRHILLANFLYPESDQLCEAAKGISLEIRRECQDAEPSASEQKSSEVGVRLSKNTDVESSMTATLKTDVEGSIHTRVAALAMKYSEDHIKQMWKDHHSAMKILLRVDSDGLDWLQQQIRGSGNIKPARDDSINSAGSDEDVKWAKAFAATAIDLYGSVNKPVRVTKSQIMKMSGWGTSNRPHPIRMPMSKRQLDILIESEWHYWARKIVWAKMTMETAPRSLSSVRIKAGVEHQRGVVLAAYFRDVKTNQVMWAGKVTDALEEYGIEKNWTGPDPCRAFYKAGRGYERRKPEARNELQKNQNTRTSIQ